MKTENILSRLNHLCDVVPGKLTGIPEKDFSFKLNPDKWSKKEILGHLIDSATNNHQRFIRIQFENNPLIDYSNEWVRFSRYNEMEKDHLIKFWTMYNRHLIEIIKSIPRDMLTRKCRAEGKEVTLSWLIEDYLEHLEYHLRQIIKYD
jgi:hypothetical protein